MQKRLIVIIAMPDALALDIIGPSDVFSCARQITEQADPGFLGGNYELIIASATEQLNVVTNSGLTIMCQKSIFDICETIDTLVIGGFSYDHNWQKFPELTNWLKTNSEQIKRICSVCVGAFVLAESGLLKNRRATTHWKFSQELGTSYENIQVDPDPIYIKDDNVYTSAGASAGIDLALALVEEDFGREVSLQIAQTLVMYLRRPGNQSQFSSLLSRQVSSKKPIRELQQWIGEHLKENLDVESLAERVSMSPRNFARVFASETGMTPAKYIEKIRVESSKRYLEDTHFSLAQIAQECGFGSPDTMRNIFMRNLKTTPYDYRNLFGAALPYAQSVYSNNPLMKPSYEYK